MTQDLESKSEVNNRQPLPPIPLMAVPVKVQAADTPAITVKPPITPSVEPDDEDGMWDMIGCDWILELKQRRRDLEERERRVTEVADILPLARELKKLGWEDHALARVQTIHECSDMEDIDLSEATEKVMQIVKYMISARKLVNYASW